MSCVPHAASTFQVNVAFPVVPAESFAVAVTVNARRPRGEARAIIGN
jgi:hypothetical protein